MREQLISLLAERIGLNEDQAGQAVDTILGFVQENPQQLLGLLGGNSEQLASLLGDNPPVDLDDLTGSLGKLFGG
ncbi:MAG: hypothetical protein K1X87_04190 [Dehalococcoidia bacterium]|nr:hypothetical protein [Dehalococcoidia bacterium]